MFVHRRDWSVVLAIVALLLLLFLFVYPMVVHGQATDTPTPDYGPTLASKTATPTQSDGLEPNEPGYPYGLPQFPGSWNIHLPTSEVLLGCPDWRYMPLGSSMEDLDPRWISECRHCVPFGFGGGGDGTRVPDVAATPTPCATGDYFLSNYVDWNWSFDHTSDDQLWYHFRGPFPVENDFVSGVVFDLEHGGNGACKLRIDSSVADSVFSADHWFSGPGSYCFGPGAACAALAPGAISIPSYRVISPGRQPNMQFFTGDYPDQCGVDSWAATNINWIMYGAEQGLTATPSPLPTDDLIPDNVYDLEWTCPINLTYWLDGSGTYEQVIDDVGTLKIDTLNQPIYAAWFWIWRDGGQGLRSNISNGSPSFFNVSDELLGSQDYCVGSWDVCSKRTFVEVADWFSSEGWWPEDGVIYHSLRVNSEDAGKVIVTVYLLTNERSGCDGDPEEATPTPQPTAAVLDVDLWFTGGGSFVTTGGSFPVLDMQFSPETTHELNWSWDYVKSGDSGYASARLVDVMGQTEGGGLTGVTMTLPKHYNGNLNWPGAFEGSVCLGDEAAIPTLCTMTMTGGDPKCRAPGTKTDMGDYWLLAFSYGSPRRVQPTQGIRWEMRGCAGQHSAPMHFGSGLEILTVNGVSVGIESTPTPTPTRTPTPTATSAVTPTPVIGANICEYPYFRDDVPVIGLPDLWWDNLVTEGECQTLIPGFDFEDVPLIGGYIEDLYIPRVKICPLWVRFPTMSLMGIEFPLDWFIVPVVFFLFKQIMKT